MNVRKMSTRHNTQIPGYTHIRSKKGIHEYELKANGLRVLYAQTKGTGTVTTNIVYLVGSRHEARGETGITHMLEHMMFKDTSENGKRDKVLAWKELENIGALMNATTSLDRTNYFFTLPTQYLKDMLAVEARRMRHITLTDAAFQPERANVMSEYEMYAGHPLATLDASVVATAYHAHTYGHDTIGHKTDIEDYTVEKLSQYHDTFYWPNNAYLIIVGDIPKDEVLKEVKTIFQNVPASPQPIPRTEVREPEQLGERRTTVKRQSPIQILSVHYKNVSASHPDWVPLYLLLAYLADGKLSVLHKALVDTHKASSVCPYQFPTYDAFLCGIYVYVSQNTSLGEVEEEVLAAIEMCKKKKLIKKELLMLKNKVRASELYERDGGNAIAGSLTEYVGTGDWTNYFTLLEQIDTVTPDDLQRVARTYLTETRRTIGSFVGTTK